MIRGMGCARGVDAKKAARNGVKKVVNGTFDLRPTCADEMPTKPTPLIFLLRRGDSSTPLGSTRVALRRFPIVPMPNLVPSSIESLGF
jgi:hypothetical protein